MISQKIRKPNKRIALFLGIAAFICGNRLTLLTLNSENPNIFMAINEAIDRFFPSFSFSQQGLTVDFRLPSLLVSTLVVLFAEALYYYFMTKRRNYKVGEEHGSARYGTLQEAQVLKDPDPFQNIILSENVQLSINTRKTFLNNNVLACGGSGSGKTRFLVKPNLLQFLSNVVVTDPKGTLVKEYGQTFIDKGYDLKILDLNNMDNSMRYNPYHYCKSATDIMKFLNNLMENTKDPNKTGGDEFWDKAGLTLLMALSFLIMGTDYPQNQNIPRIMDLLDMMEAAEDDDSKMSVMDFVFQELQEEVNAKLQSGDPKLVLSCKNSYQYLACRQYSLFKKAAGKTAKSILITLSSRLSVFNLPQLNDLLSKDELHLETIGNPKIRKGKESVPDSDPEKYIKTALFICISDSDSTFSFLAAIIYQQLFDLLYKQADIRPLGALPIPVQFILDEFANTGKILDFEKKISTVRSRNIFVFILLQALSQLKFMYQNDVWETIYGNCDTTIFLGGKEFTTLEYLSKNIGNTTIDYMSIQETKGANGSWSRSNQLIQRQLLPPDEIKRLKPNECLIDVRGHYIYRDCKYDLTHHSHYNMTADADQSKYLNPYHYIKEQREAHQLDAGWEMDPANYADYLEDMDIIDVSQEEMELYLREVS